MQKHWKRELEIWKHGLGRDLVALCQCTCARDWALTAFILLAFAHSTFKLTKVFIIDLFYGKIIKDFYGPNTNFKYFQGLKTDCYNSRVLKTYMNEPWYTLTDCYTPTRTDPRKGSWGVGVLEPSTPIFLLQNGTLRFSKINEVPSQLLYRFNWHKCMGTRNVCSITAHYHSMVCFINYVLTKSQHRND